MEVMKEVAKRKRTKTPARNVPPKRKRLAKCVGTQTESLEDILKMIQNNIRAMTNVMKKFTK
jgi:hypothetical protein